ncbi:sensor domain-containing protein [Cognatiluteimonas profundi]|uniref:sensor domain-containing protein n=1 Tax=Cognatiluteimonas profundi TaxID=2594501 RepID=UPI00131D81D5|nr:EAL domain-containing protein [Lysobacter profundi]
MNAKAQPIEAALAAGADNAGRTLAALQAACDDPALPLHVRSLLEQACDTTHAALIRADNAQQRYKALFDALPDPISILSWDGVLLDINRAGEDAYRRPRTTLIGQPLHLLNPDLPRDHLGPVHDSLGRGETSAREVTHMRADGTRFPAEVHAARLDHDGQACILSVTRDLTDRARIELHYRELMEVVDKGILVRDAERNIVYANPAAVRMFNVESGMSLAEEIRDGQWLIIDEDGNAMPDDALPAYRALSTGRVADSTVLGFYNVGMRQLTWLSVTSVPQFAPGADKPHQVLSLFSDVTELKRDGALFDRVQALAHIGGWEWDASRCRLHLSDETVRILGSEAQPTSMDAVLDCLEATDRRCLQDAIDESLAQGSGFDLEVQGRRHDGTAFWARVIGEADGNQPLSQRLTGTLQDVTRRKLAEATLRIQARTDPLTGLLNRDAALGEIAACLDDPAQAYVAVLYIDLDRFKVVNDVLGHAAGDELLMAAAGRIGKAVGREGLIARFGGDEFLVVCDFGDDPRRPERIADRILDSFAESFRFEHEEFTITASIGIARAPGDGDTPQALIQNADTAMYDSKRRIRNGWQAFTPALAQTQQERLRVETQLRRAADNNEFHLVYQPQVDLRHGRIVGAEALIRWQNDHLGEMRPDRFIGHAEVTGDIVRIGSWVLREACRQICAWRESGLGIVRVAVNVSYRQFLGDDLAQVVAGVLQEFGLPGAALELEFTERVLIEDAPDTIRTFAALRELGVVLTIDDFGEGYSALNYLRRLPIHGLKLSQLFLHGVPGNNSDVAVCQAVAGIARSLGLGLVAEGVETTAQRSFLLDLGVPVGQGFLFAPGLRADEFARRLDLPSSIIDG